MDLTGDAWFQADEAQGRSDRMRYDSAVETLELFRGRKQAWIQLQGGREVVADWMRYHLADERLDSRKGEILPPDDEGGTR